MTRHKTRLELSARVVVLAFLLVAVVALLPAGAQIDYQNYGDGGGGSGCSYCNSSNCGCSAPPAGTTLYYSCGCSSTDCWHTCDYR